MNGASPPCGPWAGCRVTMRLARLLPVLAALPLLGACQGAGLQGAALRPSVQPQELLGRDGPGLADALGLPARVRKEAEAQIWQYDGGSCVLDIFLYPDGGQTLRAVHLEARDNAGKRMEAALCIGRVQHPVTT